jgi:ABC-type glycerol-3-phosphate transport system permease component
MSLKAKIAVYGVLCVLAIAFLFPTWWVLTSSVKPVNEIFQFPPTMWPRHADFGAYRQVFELQPFARQYFNSLYIAALGTVGTLAVAPLAGSAVPAAPELWLGGRALAADPGADLRRAERAGDVHHAAVLPRATG